MHLTNDQLSTLYGRHSEELFRFFRREVADSQAAIDLVGETFAQAVRGRKKFRGDSLEDARAWLFGIARNLVRTYHKRGVIERKMMESLGLERVEVSSDPDEEPELTAEETSALVEESLAQLKPEYREAIELRYLANREYSSVAEALGVTEDVARARVSRGIKRLRQLAFETERAEGSA